MEAQLLPPRPAHDCWKWEHRVPMRTLDQKGKTRHRLSDLCRYKGTCIFGVFSCIRFWPHSYWKLQWSVGRGKDSESDRNRCRPPPPTPHQRSWGEGRQSQAWRSHHTGPPFTAWWTWALNLTSGATGRQRTWGLPQGGAEGPQQYVSASCLAERT